MPGVSRPFAIRLDASTYCQLKCPSCPTTNGLIKEHLGRGFLSVENFRKILDENPTIVHVELSNWGEIFLNPDLYEIIRSAYERNVVLTAGTGVNLNFAKQEVLEALVKYRFAYMCCSVDGASQEIYSQYRVGGSFDRVIENIETIFFLRRELIQWLYNILYNHV